MRKMAAPRQQSEAYTLGNVRKGPAQLQSDNLDGDLGLHSARAINTEGTTTTTTTFWACSILSKPMTSTSKGLSPVSLPSNSNSNLARAHTHCYSRPSPLKHSQSPTATHRVQYRPRPTSSTRWSRIEMGFMPQEARVTLTATQNENGLDVQAAAALLLNGAGGGRSRENTCGSITQKGGWIDGTSTHLEVR